MFFEVDHRPDTGFSIGLQAHARLTCGNQGWVVQKLVNANPSQSILNVFLYKSVFLCFLFFLCSFCLRLFN